MYKALKDGKIIAVNETGEFPCLVYDEIKEEDTRLANDYVHIEGEFVLKTDEKAIQQAKQERIEELKQLLTDSDYWGQKYLDGEYTEEEWEEKKAQRKAWREEIRGLQNDA